MERLTVACFWWTDPRAKCRNIYTYTADHVRTLYRMVQANLSLPHEFVCVTDRPEKITFCRTVPLDRSVFVPGTRFAKLMMFRRDAGGIGERILYLDLDCVITGSLDSIADRPEDLVLWRNPNFAWLKNGGQWVHDGIGMRKRARYNTSIMLIRAGCRPDLYEEFRAPSDRYEWNRGQKWGGTDQAWVSTRVDWEHPAYWTADDGVYGAGRLKDYDPGVCGTALPDNAKIVFFPGSRIPQLPETRAKHPWIKTYLP